MICPICEQELEIEQASNYLNTGLADTEDVWVCKNPKCKNFDEIVYDMGDLE